MRHYIKTVIYAIIFIVIGTINVNAQNIYEVVSSTKLNIRSEPNSNSKILGTLPPKAQIEIMKIEKGWAEFKYNNQNAFVSSKYIVKIDVNEKLELFKVVSKSRLNVRNKPSTNSRIIGVLQPESLIEVFSKTEYWAKIRYNNNIGYISTKYIEKIELDSAVTTEKEPVEDSLEQNTEPIIDEVLVHQSEDNADLLNSIGVEFIPNIYCGFSNLCAEGVTPKGTIGYGVDLAFQFIAKKKIIFIPKNYFSEISLGYSLRGSAAFPMHYLNIKLLPFGYRYHLQKFSLFGKLGLYTGFTFSSIETNYNSFNSNVDIGLAINVGSEYKKIGLGLSYERGFTNVCNSNLSLKNSCVFVTLSYRLFSLK